MHVGVLELDLLLGDVHSLKGKRGVVRPIVSELRRRFEVAAAEAGHRDLHRRALVGVAVVSADAAHCRDVLDACERWVAELPEVELLSARRRWLGDGDEGDDEVAGNDEVVGNDEVAGNDDADEVLAPTGAGTTEEAG